MNGPVALVREHWLSALIGLVIAVLGVPQVWNALQQGDLGVEVLFFPVLGAAFAFLALSRR